MTKEFVIEEQEFFIITTCHKDNSSNQVNCILKYT